MRGLITKSRPRAIIHVQSVCNVSKYIDAGRPKFFNNNFIPSHRRLFLLIKVTCPYLQPFWPKWSSECNDKIFGNFVTWTNLSISINTIEYIVSWIIKFYFNFRKIYVNMYFDTMKPRIPLQSSTKSFCFDYIYFIISGKAVVYCMKDMSLSPSMNFD